eukprot:48963-Eustigmatos_ZCMA.PRE.1
MACSAHLGHYNGKHELATITVPMMVKIGAASMDIFEAAREGDVERVRALVEQDGGIVHATDDNRDTPLLDAAEEGHLEVV